MAVSTEKTLLAVPGLERQSRGFLQDLHELAERNGWDADAIAAVISIESGFNPKAQNPKGSAFGILQWIDSTQKALGTSRAELERLNAREQLKFVEKYFAFVFQGRTPKVPGDYYAATYGRADAIGKPDSYALDAWESEDASSRKRYELNQGLDADADGVISAGDLRSIVNRRMAQAEGRRIAVPKASGGMWIAAALIGVAVVVRGLSAAKAFGR